MMFWIIFLVLHNDSVSCRLRTNFLVHSVIHQPQKMQILALGGSIGTGAAVY